MRPTKILGAVRRHKAQRRAQLGQEADAWAIDAGEMEEQGEVTGSRK